MKAPTGAIELSHQGRQLVADLCEAFDRCLARGAADEQWARDAYQALVFQQPEDTHAVWRARFEALPKYEGPLVVGLVRGYVQARLDEGQAS